MRKITKDEFEEGIKMHQFEMYRFAFSILRTNAEAWNALEKATKTAFQHRGNLRNRNEFKTWMIQILAAESKRLLKPKEDIVLFDGIQTYHNQQSDEPSVSEDDHGLWEFIMQLEDELRPIVVLFYYDGYSTKEISRMMRLPERMVKLRITRARGKITNIGLVSIGDKE